MLIKSVRFMYRENVVTVDRTIRKSQVISPFGPGAIYDFGDESFVALDITHWNIKSCNTIRLERLEKLLHVSNFKEPPIAPENRPPGGVIPHRSVPFMRFPTWLFCSKCRNMTKWGWNKEKAAIQPSCERCGPSYRLVPMRFITVCEDGHLADVDWVGWAHSRGKSGFERCEKPSLRFESDSGKGGGLKSLVVKCECGRFRDLGDLGLKDSMRQLGGKCTGRHPWQNHENSSLCSKVPQVVQRGASNAYFPSVLTALDIRSESDVENKHVTTITSHASWGTLKTIYESSTIKSKADPVIQRIVELLAGNLNVPIESVWDVLLGEMGAGAETEVTGIDDPNFLLYQEWEAFTHPPKAERTGPFVAESVDFSSFEKILPKEEVPTWNVFKNLVDEVVLAKRIRVVKAFNGFRRYDAAGNLQDPGLGKQMGWLPATEIYGEGIFISLNEDFLQAWERRVPIAAMEGLIQAREESGFVFLPEPSARFVLLHTLSHLLIRQLCFECGYSSSSLSERIYFDKDMAGMLIYTASSDSEGALGGLVREGEPNRFYSIFKTALHRGEWCSNDPICRELPRQGVRGLNKAACHACSLVAETSCDYANTLLDRTLLYGSEGIPGYFESLIRVMRGEK